MAIVRLNVYAAMFIVTFMCAGPATAASPVDPVTTFGDPPIIQPSAPAVAQNAVSGLIRHDNAAETGAVGVVPTHALTAAQSRFVNTAFLFLATASLLFCAFVAVRQRKLYPLWLFVGGVLTEPYESLVNVLGRCLWATQNEPLLLYAFGRNMPVFTTFTYMFYFPIAAVSVHLMMERGMTARTWRNLVIGSVLGAFLFELYPVNNGWWYYYGEAQPLMVANYPIWWAFCAPMAVLGAAIGTFFLRKYVVGERNSWTLMLAFPCLVAGLHMTSAFPVFIALSSSINLAVTTAAALLTIALALANFGLLGRLAVAFSGFPVARSQRVGLDRPVAWDAADPNL